MSKNSMALTDSSFSEKLTQVSKANDDDFHLVGDIKVGGDFRFSHRVMQHQYIEFLGDEGRLK